MRNPEEQRGRRWPGIRFCRGDGAAILACAAATWLLWEPVGRLALALPITLGHFFLFCNVFRMRRCHELAWAAVFIANVGIWLLAGQLRWLSVLALQTPLTFLLILLEMRRPR